MTREDVSAIPTRGINSSGPGPSTRGYCHKQVVINAFILYFSRLCRLNLKMRSSNISIYLLRSKKSLLERFDVYGGITQHMIISEPFYGATPTI